MSFIFLIRPKEKKGQRTHSVGHKGFIAEVEIKIYLLSISLIPMMYTIILQGTIKI